MIPKYNYSKNYLRNHAAYSIHAINCCEKQFLLCKNKIIKYKNIPGALSITVSRPVRRVRLPEADGADGVDGSIALSFAFGDDRSSPLRPCIYLKMF